VDAASDRAVWIVVGALVGALGAALWHRLDAPSMVVVDAEDAEASTDTDKNPRLAAAGRRAIAASGMNSHRYRCGGCEMVTTADPRPATSGRRDTKAGSTMPELRPEWVCSGCGMRCYRMTGEPFPPPTGWDRTDDRCLACAKQDESAEDTEDRARRLVLDGKKTNEIARSCQGVTKAWINDLRDELVETGDLDPATAQRASNPRPHRDSDRIKRADEAKVPAVEEALRADPSKSNPTLADELGVNTKTVAVARKRLDLPSAQKAAQERRFEEIRQAFHDHPDLSDEGIGDLLGLAGNTVGSARRKLGIPAKKAGPKRRVNA
jgi:hypothetical protein